MRFFKNIPFFTNSNNVHGMHCTNRLGNFEKWDIRKLAFMGWDGISKIANSDIKGNKWDLIMGHYEHYPFWDEISGKYPVSQKFSIFPKISYFSRITNFSKISNFPKISHFSEISHFSQICDKFKIQPFL